MRKWLRALWRIIKLPYRLIRWLVRTIAKGIRNAFHDIYEFFTFEEEDTPLGDAVASAVANPMGLMDHLVALRKHLMRAAFVMIITTAISFTFAKQTLDFLAMPAPGGLAAMRAIEPTETVGTYMWVALLLGFCHGLPLHRPGIMDVRGPRAEPPRARLGSAVHPHCPGLPAERYGLRLLILMLPVALPFLTDFMGIKTELAPWLILQIRHQPDVLYWAWRSNYRW